LGNDSWMRRGSRALLGPIVAGLPDARSISFVASGLGLAAVVCFATGDLVISNVGAALFVVSMLVERAGPLPQSAEADLKALRLAAMVHVLTFVGIGFGLRYTALGPEAIGMGIVTGFAVSALLLLANRIERGEDARSVSLGGVETADLLIIVPIMVWLGKAEVMLAIAAFVAPAMTLGLFVAFLIRQRRKR